MLKTKFIRLQKQTATVWQRPNANLRALAQTAAKTNRIKLGAASQVNLVASVKFKPQNRFIKNATATIAANAKTE